MLFILLRTVKCTRFLLHQIIPILKQCKANVWAMLPTKKSHLNEAGEIPAWLISCAHAYRLSIHSQNAAFLSLLKQAIFQHVLLPARMPIPLPDVALSLSPYPTSFLPTMTTTSLIWRHKTTIPKLLNQSASITIHCTQAPPNSYLINTTHQLQYYKNANAKQCIN